jgi:hypothetical protein
MLLVAEANKDAQAFYEHHGLVIESRVDAPGYYTRLQPRRTRSPKRSSEKWAQTYTPDTRTSNGHVSRITSYDIGLSNLADGPIILPSSSSSALH